MSTFTLSDLGYAPHFDQMFRQLDAPGAVPARVVIAHRDRWTVAAATGVELASLAGRLRDGAGDDRPVVGDWVALAPGPVITAVLPRRTALTRRAVGTASRPQRIAANVDVAFVVTSCTRELNPRRLERLITAVWDGGAEPIIVLNKADLADDLAEPVRRLGPVAAGLPLVVTAALDGRGTAELLARLGPGRTGVFVGSSGVGKSSLVNALLGDERQAVTAIRDADDKGRHTTTRRELIVLAAGGIVIDTPGMREFGMWADDDGDDDGAAAAFAEIVELAARCRFRDCGHGGEPGCAVVAGAEPDRLSAYRKLEREAEHEKIRSDPAAQRERAARWKVIARAHRQRTRMRRDDSSG